MSERSIVGFFFPPGDLISGKGEGMAVKKTTIFPRRPKGAVETLSFTTPGTQRYEVWSESLFFSLLELTQSLPCNYSYPLTK